MLVLVVCVVYNSGFLYVFICFMFLFILFEFFVFCLCGFEVVFVVELVEIVGCYLNGVLFIVGVQVLGGVYFSGGWVVGMVVNFYLWIVSCILLKIVYGLYCNEQDVYVFVFEQLWECWFVLMQMLCIDIIVIKLLLKSFEFMMLCVKDVICDWMCEKIGVCLSIDIGVLDVCVFVFLMVNECMLYFDILGELLFKCGWCFDKGVVLLCENFVVGILCLMGWMFGIVLYDLMCGSGMFFVEVVQIVFGVVFGVECWFGFEKFKQYDIIVWQGLKVLVFDVKCVVCVKCGEVFGVYGSDIFGDMFEKVCVNFECVGVLLVWFKQVDVCGMMLLFDGLGIFFVNLLYGEWIEVCGCSVCGEVCEIGCNCGNDDVFCCMYIDVLDSEFFNVFGDVLKQCFMGWQVFLLMFDCLLLGQLCLCELVKMLLFNGVFECWLFCFDLIVGSVKVCLVVVEGDV